MKEIITRYTGLFAQSSFRLNGDGDSVQIVVIDPDSKKQKIIFTGKKFSPEKYAKNGRPEEEKYLRAIGESLFREVHNQKLWRSLIRVTQVRNDHFLIVIPGWNRRISVRINNTDVPREILEKVAVGKRFHVKVNIGCEHKRELQLNEWELE